MLQKTPQEEDRALFSEPLAQCEVALIPKFEPNQNNEQVIHGFMRGDVETPVEVVFHGRRRVLADPLMARLTQLWERRRRSVDAPDQLRPERVRLPVAIYGAWRQRFSYDCDGWQSKRFQLIAAIWRIRDTTGRPITRGSAPLLKRVRRLQKT